MIKKLFVLLNINTEELINQEVLTNQAFEEINNFYKRIEDLQNDPSVAKKQEASAYDHVITHSRKVALCSTTVAKAAKFSAKDCSEIAVAAMLHDLDKLYWPAKLLDKPKNELTRADWTRIIEHAVASAVFVEQLTKHQISQGVLTIIKQHHENLDGTGYPNSLSGEKICPGARIMRITDSYDSMTSIRPYKKEVLSYEDALNDLKRRAGGVYDANIIKLFEEALPYEKISEILSD